MAFRMLGTLIPPLTQAEIENHYRFTLREIRHVLYQRDEGLLSEAEALSKVLALTIRGLRDGPLG